MYRALLICNSRFPESVGELAELHGPKKDGILLRDALTDHDAGMFNKSDVHLISEGSSAEIIGEIEKFFTSAEPDDTLLFYYSGHGKVLNQQFFLAARDTNVKSLFSTAIAKAVLDGIVTSSFAEAKILILDCCNSALAKGSDLAEKLSGRGRFVITATSVSESADDSRMRGLPSPFTERLVDGLLAKAVDRDGDGNVDLDDVYHYLAGARSGGPRPERSFDGAGAVPIAYRMRTPKSQVYSPLTSETISLAEDSTAAKQDSPAAILSYLDTLAPGTSISLERVSDFRRRMRDDIVEAIPSDLSTVEFLKQAGLYRDGFLTYAGLLLFGKNPTAVIPTAMVQCVRFNGTTKTDPLSSLDLQDTVPEMIVRARDFVANHARLGEAPTTEGAYAETAYRYPMIAVREIIANAVVHRDYKEQESCVQVHMFNDRIEVISPGDWVGSPAVAEGEAQLKELERPSQRRNFRLARTLTWSKLVEGVGAGVPRAIADCRALGVAEPTVKINGQIVIVTIFPRQPEVVSGSIQQGPVLQGRDFINPTFVTSQAAAAPVALAQLPPLTVAFTGRENELAQVAELLNPAAGAGAVVVSAVAGLAGVGKTALAVHAAHAAQGAGWFPGGVLFIDLHGYEPSPVQPGQALNALLRALGIPGEHIPEGTEQRAGLYRSALAQIADPVLIIADNASSETQVRPLIPGPGPHRVMITSRHTLAGLGARLLDVTVLDQEAAIALLNAVLRSAWPNDDRVSGDPAAAKMLVQACGGLPLALQITAALLVADPALTAAELAAEMADEVRRLGALRYDDGNGVSASSVVAAFELSYRQLDADAARMFRLLPADPGPDVSTVAAAELADWPTDRARAALGRLTRAHLVRPGDAPGRWRMHDLLRLYARQISEARSGERTQAEDRLLDYYMKTTTAADARLRALPGMPLPADFSSRDDALAWLDAEQANLISAVNLAASTDRGRIAMRLPLLLNEYLSWRRRFDDLLAVIEISRDAARRLSDRHGEGMALDNLGLALRELRRFEEAISVHQDAAVIFRETGDRHGEGMALDNLSAALREVRRFEEAISVHQDAAAIFRETGDRHGEGDALNNLGLALREVRRFEEAISVHQDAAAIFRETGDRHGEGDALNNLGLALREVRRFEEAISVHQDAAAIFRETGDRHGEGDALNNLGLALREVRRFEEAISVHQDAAVIFRETGDRHGEGQTLDGLGGAYQELRQPGRAAACWREAATVMRDAGDHKAAAHLEQLAANAQTGQRP